MPVTASLDLRIGIYGPDISKPSERHGCGLWAAGVAASVAAASVTPAGSSEATPVVLPAHTRTCWDDHLENLHGLVVIGYDNAARQSPADAEEICAWAHDHKMPILCIDNGLLALNTSHGGTVYGDLPRELPEALQHRHPPERGLRHAINIIEGTQLAELYGEGEVVVNSEHRRSVQRLARGFRVCAQALDGVIEAIEFESDWYALGVQWQPASSTASGLDIQLFRGLINAVKARQAEPVPLEYAA